MNAKTFNFPDHHRKESVALLYGFFMACLVNAIILGVFFIITWGHDHHLNLSVFDFKTLLISFTVFFIISIFFSIFIFPFIMFLKNNSLLNLNNVLLSGFFIGLLINLLFVFLMEPSLNIKHVLFLFYVAFCFSSLFLFPSYAFWKVYQWKLNKIK